MKKILGFVFFGVLVSIGFASAANNNTKVNVFFVNQGPFTNGDAELAIYIDGKNERDGIDHNDDANFTVPQGRHTVFVEVIYKRISLVRTETAGFEVGSAQLRFRATLSSVLLAGQRASNRNPERYGFSLDLELINSGIIASSASAAASLSASAAAAQLLVRSSGTEKPGIDEAIARSCAVLIEELPKNSTIAVLSISSRDIELSNFAIDELEYQLVTAKQFIMVDRKTLDTLRTEQNFQLSGDVSDQSAVAIGNMLGASIVVIGSVSGAGSTQRLTLKALDVKTTQIITMTREQF
jgi:hypothetical protein